ncbi:MAG: penicillin-binding transpeptidase domain-containing protein [bacterium]
MWKLFKIFKKSSRTKYHQDLDPDEILLDSTNLAGHNRDQFEGRLEKPISRASIYGLGIFVLILITAYAGRIGWLQVIDGNTYAERSEKNFLRNTLIFAERGMFLDREGKALAWNDVNKDSTDAYNLRKYADKFGISSILGYVKYPMKDKYGFYFSDVLEGKDGLEKYFNTELSGQDGLRIVEVNALNKVVSESTVRPPENGKNITLSIDVDLQHNLYRIMDELTKQIGFGGGSAVIMNVKTGEIVAMVNYPEYSSQAMTDGNTNLINSYLKNKNKPFLNRAINGIYAPGSTVKPFMSLAGLNEKIIDPLTNIYSSGQLVLPNPYDPSNPSIFRDWKAHGYVDMRKAIAVSSDEYFYRLGGGFEPDKQKGLGITLIDKYMKLFGFGEAVKEKFFNGANGTIPTPEWKALNFKDGVWRVGDTYHTSIGQYGFLISPIQMVRADAIIATDGKIVEPTILKAGPDDVPNITGQVDIDPSYFKIVKEGMRMGVEADFGTVKLLNFKEISVASKTGTAEIDEGVPKVNSWVTGFFPYENPKYAFTVVMERGPIKSDLGATRVMKGLFEWLIVYKPEFLKN